MLNSKSFLTVDFGAGSLKLAEFEVNEAGGLRLKQYALTSLGAEGAQESTREGVMQKALQELLAEKGIRSKNVNVSRFLQVRQVTPGGDLKSYANHSVRSATERSVPAG
jgi:Tfp pilus assembly PilM family ATPase